MDITRQGSKGEVFGDNEGEALEKKKRMLVLSICKTISQGIVSMKRGTAPSTRALQFYNKGSETTMQHCRM